MAPKIFLVRKSDRPAIDAEIHTVVHSAVTLMPWRCPACGEQIQHSVSEPMPRIGTLYRCHVCRLELIVDIQTQKLVLAPFDDSNPAPSSGRSR
jgi:predicted RNA-binding Zn-ribbon protein involved in translation (DUF1610 family)